MTQRQKLAVSHRTVLLATDSSHTVIAEVVDGKTNTITYSTYGEQSAQLNVETRLGFNGQLREANIGWYLLGNGYRAYNPRLMRFHSPDTWSPFNGGGLNAYMYCVGDPVNRSDPTGHMSFMKFLGKSFDFFFGGADITGPRRLTRDQASTIDRLGGMRPEKTGEGRALATVGGAVAGNAPVSRSRGMYPSKGDGSTNGTQWGTTPAHIQRNRPSSRPGHSGNPSTASSRRGSVRVLYDGPDPQYIPRPREEMTLLGKAPVPDKHMFAMVSANEELRHPPAPPTPPPPRPRSPWRIAMDRTDEEMRIDWDVDSD